ncbi:MAG: PEGA domain-containing protein [Pseudomonadota bacterium]|nr:PEGA domain-containing protein [Pseudomonadota bacterium]
MLAATLAFFLALAGLVVPLAVAADGPAGILKVRSNVEGAEVWVDGAALGVTPLTKYLAAGVHQIRVVADRHDPFVRRVEIVADKTLDVQASLSPGGGTVEFSGPPGARLVMDGTDRGPLPIRLPAPSAGPHPWRVEAPKFEPAEGMVDFVAGKNYLVDVPMMSSRGIVVVESSPAGAAVKLDGADVGVTPLRLADIEPGRHVVLLTHPEAAGVLRVIDTTDGSRGEVRASLPSSGGTLDITTGSPDALVFLDGTRVGEGTHVTLGPLEKGRWKLQIRIGERQIIDTVAVPVRGTVALRVSGDLLVERKPLVQRWGFWAIVGGAAVASGATTAAVVVATAPEPPPTGDTVVELP